MYGVVRAGAKRPRDSGIHGRPVRLVADGDIGALVSDVPDEPLEAGRDELLAHSRVLERALRRGVVLPMRFGIVMPDEETLRADLLDAHRDALVAQLDEMDDKVEMSVKGIYEEHAILKEVLEENPRAAKLREAVRGKPQDASYYERIELGELIAGGIEAKREVDARTIVDRLAPLSLAVESAEPVHERMAVNASFLLERAAVPEFDQALDAIAAEQADRIRFRAAGPLPPHTFVELSVEA